MADLVSLIMPVWRPRPDWVRQAVEAALAERGCEIELLVIDDGSPEPASEALSSFEDPRLRILRIEHGGVANARNVATEAARGSFLRFIDGDSSCPDRCAMPLESGTPIWWLHPTGTTPSVPSSKHPCAEPMTSSIATGGTPAA